MEPGWEVVLACDDRTFPPQKFGYSRAALNIRRVPA